LAVGHCLAEPNGLLPSYANVKFLIFAPKPRLFLFEYISETSSLEAKVSNGNSNSISEVDYPIFDQKYLIENEKNYPISFNGKFRFNINLSLSLTNDEIKQIVLSDNKTVNFLKSKKVKKVIIVPNKIINIVF